MRLGVLSLVVSCALSLVVRASWCAELFCFVSERMCVWLEWQVRNYFCECQFAQTQWICIALEENDECPFIATKGFGYIFRSGFSTSVTYREIEHL